MSFSSCPAYSTISSSRNTVAVALKGREGEGSVGSASVALVAAEDGYLSLSAIQPSKAALQLRSLKLSLPGTPSSLAWLPVPASPSSAPSAGPAQGARADAVVGTSTGTLVTVDTALGEEVARLSLASDSVSSLVAVSTDLVAAGCFDGSVVLVDVAKASVSARLEHGAPVHAVELLAAEGGTSTLVASAGSVYIRVWDVGTRRLVTQLTGPAKTVTSLAFDAARGLLYAGSLDGTVRAYDTATWQSADVDGTPMRFPAAVLSVATHRGTGNFLAVGLASGLLAVTERALSALARLRATKRRLALDSGAYRHFLQTTGAPGDFAVVEQESSRRRRLSPYAAALGRFEHREALQLAVRSGSVDELATVVRELSIRGVLRQAVGQRDDKGVLSLLRAITRSLAVPRHAVTTLTLAHAVLDVYGELAAESPAVLAALANLRHSVVAELAVQRDVQRVQGGIEWVLSSR